MKVGVYNLYWQTLGGGEQVAGAIAEVLAADHEVELLGPSEPPIGAMRDRLGIELGGTGYHRATDDAAASEASADYDLFVTTTYLSTAANRARRGLYYAHFPEAPPSRRTQWVGARKQATASALGRLPVQPGRVVALRNQLSAGHRSLDFLSSYSAVLGNSAYTNSWIERLWGVPAELLHPPVRMIEGSPVKRRTIASVGRFFDARYGHSKKQLEMVLGFRKLVASGRADGWELHLVGGCDMRNREYFNAVRKAAIGLPVELHLNASGEVLEDVVSHAAIYWHAGGIGEDPVTHPDRFEHFGIAVVEAMSAGAVPVVFAAAGPAEVVRDGVDGRHWRTLDELATTTAELIAAPAQLAGLSVSATTRAKEFDRSAFARRLRSIVAGLS